MLNPTIGNNLITTAKTEKRILPIYLYDLRSATRFQLDQLFQKQTLTRSQIATQMQVFQVGNP